MSYKRVWSISVAAALNWFPVELLLRWWDRKCSKRPPLETHVIHSLTFSPPNCLFLSSDYCWSECTWCEQPCGSPGSASSVESLHFIVTKSKGKNNSHYIKKQAPETWILYNSLFYVKTQFCSNSQENISWFQTPVTGRNNKHMKTCQSVVV